MASAPDWTALEDAPSPRAWHLDEKDKDPRTEAQRVASFLSMRRYIAPTVDIVAVPNAGRRTRWEAMQRKREGMTAGALDYFLTWPGGGIAFIEFKDGRGMPDDNQMRRLDMYVRQGHLCGVFRTGESAWGWLERVGAPVRMIP